MKQRWRVLEPIYKKAKYAILAVKLGGISYLLAEIERRTYRKETFIGLEKYLKEAIPELGGDIEYSLSLASPEDIAEAFYDIKREGRENLFDLLQRKWFYETGFRNCYLARARLTNEICYMEWTVSLKDANSNSRIFKSSFPWLGQQDMQLEHSYTFKKYRGKKLMTSVTSRLFKIARDEGYQRAIGFALADNAPALKALEKAGFRKFVVIQRTKFLFYTQYKINQKSLTHHSEVPIYSDVKTKCQN
jgi:hypothetical protein